MNTRDVVNMAIQATDFESFKQALIKRAAYEDQLMLAKIEIEGMKEKIAADHFLSAGQSVPDPR